MDSALTTALEQIGGVAALARALGISSQAISQWDRVPPTRLLAVTRATGIPGHVLRPDVCSAPPDTNGHTVAERESPRKRTRRRAA